MSEDNKLYDAESDSHFGLDSLSDSLARSIREISAQSLGLTALSAQIDETCGKGLFTSYAEALSPLSDIALWGNKWNVHTFDVATSAFTNLTKDILHPGISELASLEAQTSLIAKDFGLSKITSVATQLSTIEDVFSVHAESIRELIAPASMLEDLQAIATVTHKAIVDTGNLSAWQLGIVDSASFLADRQIDWASQLCSSIFADKSFAQIEDIGAVLPSVNVLSSLPLNLEEVKANDDKISPEVALEKTTAYQLTEKGKRLVNKIVDVNKMCERTGRKAIFKYTGGTTVAAAMIGGTVCSTKEAFGSIIDGLYMFFYENLEHIKNLVSEDAVRNESVYQCVFRVKDIRTDFRHDYEHGTESQIRKKNMAIGNSYTHYTGHPVLVSSKDYYTAQDKLYDEFDQLADHLLSVVGG